MRKGEIACNNSHNAFHSYISLVHQKGVFCGNG